MSQRPKKSAANAHTQPLSKCPTGIQGLDEITLGGFPRGRPTLLCGGAGSGKTLLGMEFLIRGAVDYGEPGVFIAFEETPEELAQNVASLGYDVNKLVKQKKLAIDYVHLDRAEILETGEYDLEALFVRIAYAADTVGAKRIVLDTIEAIFAGLSNDFILRDELRRLFRWLKSRGLTAVITAERGAEGLTRQGLEEYVSDCVIVLDHRVSEQAATRRLRIVKYRGTSHGTNEYPFVIDRDGFSVLPITSLGLDQPASSERISSGIPELDAMLGGKGFFRGSTILITGSPGTGKTTLVSQLADAACRRGERCLYFAYEESPSQILRNMKSVGLDLAQWIKQGLLQITASRPTLLGLEMHLLALHREVERFRPRIVILDPITDFDTVGTRQEAKAMLLRILDFLKAREITAVCTSLVSEHVSADSSEAGLSSVIDSWLLLRNIEHSNERNRAIQILKSRGMAHSNQIREFVLTAQGAKLLDVALGPNGDVLTGAARVAQQEMDESSTQARQRAVDVKRQSLARRHAALQARITALEAEFEAETQMAELEIEQERLRAQRGVTERHQVASSRNAEPGAAGQPKGPLK